MHAGSLLSRILFSFFPLMRFSSRHARKSANKSKRNRRRPLRAPLATKRVFCSLVYRLLLHVIASRGNDFRVRVRRIPRAFFSSPGTMCVCVRRRRCPRNRVEPIHRSCVTFVRTNARFIPHFPSLAMPTTDERVACTTPRES